MTLTHTEQQILNGKIETPVYVYDLDEVRRNFCMIRDSIPYPKKRIYYAVMANNHPEILRVIKDLDGGVQINSLHELNLVKEAGFQKNRISFTSIGVSTIALERLIQEDVQVNLDSIEETEKFSKLNPNGGFGIRLHMLSSPLHPTRGGFNSRNNVGISEKDLDKIPVFPYENRTRVNSIHGYLGSDILEVNPFLIAADYIIRCARKFPEIEYVNFGGGFGVSVAGENVGFNFKRLGKHYVNLMRKFSSELGRDIELRIEPGRAVVASAGTLYTKVTNVKRLKDSIVREISVDAGFGEFARFYVYGVSHRVSVLGKEDKECKGVYMIRANTTLQGDFLSESEVLPEVREGDVLAIRNTGAYGRVMASGFPGKELPGEVCV